MELDFQTFKSTHYRYKSIYEDLLAKTCKYLNIQADLIVSVTICDNNFIQEMNKEYRNIDRPTDVISFAFMDNDKMMKKMLHTSGSLALGDIYISYEKASEQAKEYSHTMKREFSFLFVHGLLHLLGYDHMSKEEEDIMFPLQEKILSL